MKRLLFTSSIILSVNLIIAQVNPAGELDPRFSRIEKGIKSADLDFLSKSDFNFTNIKVNPSTAVKNQQQTGTCWAFSTTSLIESQAIKNNVGNTDLSEMFTVRNIYIEKAKNYILRQGHAQFSQGGLGHDLIRSIANYGAMPEEAYRGLPGNAKSYNHELLFADLKKYIDSVIDAMGKNVTVSKNGTINDWLKGYNDILNKYMGAAPEKFLYKFKPYTPQTFAKNFLRFNSDDYINITSFTHHPFYKPFIVEVPDNFSNGAYYNLPINEMIESVELALNKGYTVLWDADVSNDGFNQKIGLALNLSTDSKNIFNKMNPDATESVVYEKTRQKFFENLVTQDDHLMHIVGIEKSKEGKTFFIVKNSWGESAGPYKGYIHVSESYFALNTISLVLPKAALNKALLDKLK